MIQIQYDERKKQINLRKHNITIPELATIFEDSDTIFDIPDEVHSHLTNFGISHMDGRSLATT